MPDINEPSTRALFVETIGEYLRLSAPYRMSGDESRNLHNTIQKSLLSLLPELTEKDVRDYAGSNGLSPFDGNRMVAIYNAIQEGQYIDFRQTARNTPPGMWEENIRFNDRINAIQNAFGLNIVPQEGRTATLPEVTANIDILIETVKHGKEKYSSDAASVGVVVPHYLEGMVSDNLKKMTPDAFLEQAERIRNALATQFDTTMGKVNAVRAQQTQAPAKALVETREVARGSFAKIREVFAPVIDLVMSALGRGDKTEDKPRLR